MVVICYQLSTNYSYIPAGYVTYKRGSMVPLQIAPVLHPQHCAYLTDIILRILNQKSSHCGGQLVCRNPPASCYNYKLKLDLGFGF